MSEPRVVAIDFYDFPEGYAERWTVEPPERGQPYLVDSDKWNDDFTIRTIFAWTATSDGTT